MSDDGNQGNLPTWKSLDEIGSTVSTVEIQGSPFDPPILNPRGRGLINSSITSSPHILFLLSIYSNV